MASSVVLSIVVLAVLLGPLVWRVPINEIDFAAKLEGPSWAHPFGTDDLGQDVLARLLYGGRVSLAVGLCAMLVAATVGVLIGSIAGMSRGVVDAFLMWLADLFLSLPALPLLLLIIYLFRESLKGALGPEGGVFVMIVAVIGGLRWMQVARLVRAQILSIREKEFIEAARALGASTVRQVTRHILPNALGPVIVAATLVLVIPPGVVGIGLHAAVRVGTAAALVRRLLGQRLRIDVHYRRTHRLGDLHKLIRRHRGIYDNKLLSSSTPRAVHEEGRGPPDYGALALSA